MLRTQGNMARYISKPGKVLQALLVLLKDLGPPGNTRGHLFTGFLRVPRAPGAPGSAGARPSFLMYTLQDYITIDNVPYVNCDKPRLMSVGIADFSSPSSNAASLSSVNCRLALTRLLRKRCSLGDRLSFIPESRHLLNLQTTSLLFSIIHPFSPHFCGPC